MIKERIEAGNIYELRNGDYHFVESVEQRKARLQREAEAAQREAEQEYQDYLEECTENDFEEKIATLFESCPDEQKDRFDFAIARRLAKESGDVDSINIEDCLE